MSFVDLLTLFHEMKIKMTHLLFSFFLSLSLFVMSLHEKAFTIDFKREEPAMMIIVMHHVSVALFVGLTQIHSVLCIFFIDMVFVHFLQFFSRFKNRLSCFSYISRTLLKEKKGNRIMKRHKQTYDSCLVSLFTFEWTDDWVHWMKWFFPFWWSWNQSERAGRLQNRIIWWEGKKAREHDTFIRRFIPITDQTEKGEEETRKERWCWWSGSVCLSFEVLTLSVSAFASVSPFSWCPSSMTFYSSNACFPLLIQT